MLGMIPFPQLLQRQVVHGRHAICQSLLQPAEFKRHMVALHARGIVAEPSASGARARAT
jgi:hypothetical protein